MKKIIVALLGLIFLTSTAFAVFQFKISHIVYEYETVVVLGLISIMSITCLLMAFNMGDLVVIPAALTTIFALLLVSPYAALFAGIVTVSCVVSNNKKYFSASASMFFIFAGFSVLSV